MLFKCFEQYDDANAVDKHVKGLFKKYKREFRCYESLSLKRKHSRLSVFDYLQLGEELDRFESYWKFFEAGKSSDLGKPPEAILDLITVANATNVLSLIGQQRTMKTQVGNLHYKVTKATNTRGNISAADKLRDPRGVNKFPVGFAGEFVDVAVGTGDAMTTSFTPDGTAFAAAVKPLRKYSVRVYLTDDDSVYAVDENGDGKLVGPGLTGTVDYSDASMTLTFDSAPADPSPATGNIKARAASDYEGDVAHGKIERTHDIVEVRAQIFALSSPMSVFEAWDLGMQFGQAGMDTLLQDVVDELNAETAIYGIDRIIQQRSTGNDVAFNVTASGVSKIDRANDIRLGLKLASSKITTNGGRGRSTCWIVDDRALYAVEALDGYREVPDSGANGPRVVGRLGEVPVIHSGQIPDPGGNDADIYGIYKNPLNPFDGALFIGTYMPLYSAGSIPHTSSGSASNPFVQDAAAAAWIGMELAVPKLVCNLDITNMEDLTEAS